MTLADLDKYEVVIEDALHSTLRDNTSIYGVSPPAGGLILQYLVSVMDGYHYDKSWEDMSEDEKTLFYQRFAEAMKFAYARRTELGDEDFVPEVTEVSAVMVCVNVDVLNL